ncbi:hypothetical protein IJL65_05235 [bacterium]|nr:hypothetical protein [bacterium]
MKYLLKFKIETWGDDICDDKEYNLILKVEFIEERVKEEGFFELGRGSWKESRLIFRFKSCEVAEGPKEIPGRFLLWRNDCQEYVAIALEVSEDCTGARFMGFEPVPDEESQSISSQQCE